LFYYPKESLPFVISDILRVAEGSALGLPSDPGFSARVHAAADFVSAVVWCGDSGLRDALTTLFAETSHVRLLLAALPGVRNVEQERVANRIATFVEQLPSDELGAYGVGRDLLVAAVQRAPVEAEAIMHRYLVAPSPLRVYTACLVLQETKPSWCIHALRPLLLDKRVVNGYAPGAATGAGGETDVPLRACDAAATTLAGLGVGYRFVFTKDVAARDSQIAVMREQLTAGSRPSAR
jgi:hypothetical protein